MSYRFRAETVASYSSGSLETSAVRGPSPPVQYDALIRARLRSAPRMGPVSANSGDTFVRPLVGERCRSRTVLGCLGEGSVSSVHG